MGAGGVSPIQGILAIQLAVAGFLFIKGPNFDLIILYLSFDSPINSLRARLSYAQYSV